MGDCCFPVVQYCCARSIGLRAGGYHRGVKHVVAEFVSQPSETSSAVDLVHLRDVAEDYEEIDWERCYFINIWRGFLQKFEL